MGEYTHNHYVPVWYQRRFMLPGQSKYFRLDLKPDMITTPKGKIPSKAEHEWSPEGIFAQDDLYTTKWGTITNTEIEKFFFGKLDNDALAAVEYFSNFSHTSANEKAFNTLLPYMSVQKLRSPKGLVDLAERAESQDNNMTLMLLQRVQNMFCAVWTEAVWQIADASNSPTKFIISDHPVTVYNRACPPLSKWCEGHNDPDVRLNATHTFFPLSLDKVLILTNLSWARDPYQNETRYRPNPGLFRTAIFNFLSVQVNRTLTEDEVLQINSITKRRAFRYIAAAKKEWLFPEKYCSTDNWKKFGDGWLLMPEQRLLYMGGEVVIGYRGGGGDSFSEYGHRPWEKGYKDEDRSKRETESLYRFKAEWAMKHGRKYTAVNEDFGGRLTEDSEDMTTEHKRTLEKFKKKR
jgi:hypothetical protein